MLGFIVRSMVALPLLQALGVQSVASTSAKQQAKDSATLVRIARSAQASFELFRRNRLPTSDRASGLCDVHIGRYCYWRGDGDDDEQPPPEEPRIRERRDGLIAFLDSLSRMLPGDGWIAGQYVRYLVEAGRSEEAMRYAATECGAAAGWCDALAGYAAHSGSHFAAADSAYSRALAAMDSTERCRWLDISDLVDDDVQHRLATLRCDAREQLTRRVFWLGAPLYSVSETDLLTEHLARLTRARMAEHSASVDGQAWADDVRALVIRYGWSRWYSRTPAPLGSMSDPSYTGHDAGMPYDFFPRVHAVDHVGHAALDDWALDDSRAPAGYAPAYARSVHDLPHQIATFRRGDSTIVVAAWDARADTTLLGRPLDAALVVAADGAERGIVRKADASTTGRLWTVAVIDSGLASLELLASKDRRAARARIGIRGRADSTGSAVAISDLLLYAPTLETPYALDAVRDSALTSDVIAGSRGIGVYWELYGLPNAEPVRFTLAVELTSVGWMHRAAEQLHLADPTSALSIRWDEVPQQADGIAGRGVRVDLGQLRSGSYRITLTVATAGGVPVIATRQIELR